MAFLTKKKTRLSRTPLSIFSSKKGKIPLKTFLNESYYVSAASVAQRIKKFAPVWLNFSGEMKNRTNLHFLASPLPFSPFPSPPSLKKLQHKGNSTFLLPPLPLLIVAPLPLFPSSLLKPPPCQRRRGEI